MINFTKQGVEFIQMIAKLCQGENSWLMGCSPASTVTSCEKRSLMAWVSVILKEGWVGAHPTFGFTYILDFFWFFFQESRCHTTHTRFSFGMTTTQAFVHLVIQASMSRQDIFAERNTSSWASLFRIIDEASHNIFYWTCQNADKSVFWISPPKLYPIEYRIP